MYTYVCALQFTVTGGGCFFGRCGGGTGPSSEGLETERMLGIKKKKRGEKKEQGVRGGKTKHLCGNWAPLSIVTHTLTSV